MALLRPSELARLWELHPKTVYSWIREGRLRAIKTPGAQYRVRSDDARAYCEKNNLPMPRDVSSPRGAVAAIGKPSATQRSLARACKVHGATFATFPGTLDGLLAVASDVPDVLAIDARVTEVKLEPALGALRKNAKTAPIPVVVYDAPSRTATLAGLGESSVIVRGDPEDASRAVLDILEAVMASGARRGRG
jgi:excisionase family DNA binding protein